MRFLVFSLTVVLLSSAVVACGEQIPNRDALNGILGPNVINEDFESLDIGDAMCMVLPPSLDSETVVDEQGPGLIVEGVSFELTNTLMTGLSWCGKDTSSHASKYLAASLTATSALDIDFSVDATACGLNFFQNVENTINVRLYAPDDTTVVDSLQVSIVPDTPVFFGYFEAGGIGKLRVWPTSAFDSIPFDSVAFGVPEPSTFLLLLTFAPAGYALLRRKRAV